MPISDLYDSGFRNRIKGHFASLVRVALTDGVITADERKFLEKIAVKLEISNEIFDEIVADPNKYPLQPPLLHSYRLERLHDLARMVHADHEVGEKQRNLLTKYAIFLGFTAANAPYIVDKALTLAALDVDLDTFTYEMNHMNR